ncbi:MAG: hypothetical protein IT449_16805 [Phycisphaerales bacterium]|nr:hypothetical protein [Phycisphaerales bacterium]
MSRSCEQCGADSPDIARFCRQCGRPLRGRMIRSATRVTAVMEQWRRLSTSMTRKEVRKLLGEPLRIEAPASADPNATETWQYEYAAAGAPDTHLAGDVMFSTTEARVLRWTEPDWLAAG